MEDCKEYPPEVHIAETPANGFGKIAGKSNVGRYTENGENRPECVVHITGGVSKGLVDEPVDRVPENYIVINVVPHNTEGFSLHSVYYIMVIINNITSLLSKTIFH